MKFLKQGLLDVAAILFFAFLAFAYFYPADVENRVLNQGDISAGIGAGEEGTKYLEKTGERTRWTNSLFSGMPTYQIAPSYDSTTTVSTIEKAYHLWLPDNVWYLFVYLLGFYILLRAFDFRQHLAALGSVFWAFSTYFLIIIAAGHLWKVMALAYLPPMIAGIVLAYRNKKYLWGLAVTSIFTALEIHANHVQMTYYYMFVILFMVIAFLVEAILKKEYAHFLKATAACVVGGLLGVLVNASNLYHTWQYSKETMRGKSELVKENAANQTNSGLERSYITDYSYGIGETWTLLVPNAKGGTSTRLLFEDEGAKDAVKDMRVDIGGGQVVPVTQMFDYLMQNGLYFTQYWDKHLEEGSNGTVGPVYVGAFVLMLFILGLFIVRGPLKWGLLAATVLSIMLAWGKNFMGLTDFFIDYVPMYAKFRAVESILVIAEFTIPLLAMMALKQLIDDRQNAAKPQVSKFNLQTFILVAFALTGGVALLFALIPSVFFNFYTPAEDAIFNQIMPGPAATTMLEALSRARQAVFVADCWRSFFIILAGTLTLLLYKAKKLNAVVMVAVLLVICLVDLWQVNRRYLNPNDTKQFMKKSERKQIRPMTEVDRQILDDPTLYYRVLNLAGNVFNENETSYYHKSIGGYHAAKLRRYQELIDAYISPQWSAVRDAVPTYYGDLTQVNGDSIWSVLNMLNAKYFIYPGAAEPIQNPYAYGNAWFVDKVVYVDNANQELEALAKLDLRHEAVADKRFESVLGEAIPQDSTQTVELTVYEPNQLTFHVNSDKGGVLVFSDIYYPGWTATVDGSEVEIGRVNYVLRALRLTPGSHEVVLSFFPTSVATTETIAYISLCIMGLLIVALPVVRLVRRKKK